MNWEIKYKGIRDVRNLFNQLIDEDYYRPIKTKSAFNGNITLNMKAMGTKIKIYQLKNILL